MKTIIRSFIILIISILPSTTVMAQHNFFAGFRVGYALPMGQFASHEYGTGGYALLGKTMGCEAGWFISPKLGFGIDASVNTFGFATGYYAEDMAENSSEIESSVEMLSGPYSIRTLMGGLYYRFEIMPKFFSTCKLMGGMFSAQTPDQFHGAVIFVQGKNYWWKTGSLDRTFGLHTGVSFEYNVFEHVDVLLQADFSYAQPSFIYYRGNETYTQSMKMPVFKLLPGINIRF